VRWPWHHKHRAKKNIAAVAQTIQGIQLSSSAVGSAIPLVYGQARVAARLIHYKKLTLGTQISGGPSVGSDDPNNAAIAMALCEGPVAGVLKAFDDKDQTDYVMDIFLPGTDFTPGTTTALTLRQAPIVGSVFQTYPIQGGGLAIASVVGSVVNFTAPIPFGTTAVVLSYQVTGSLAAHGFVTFLGTLSQAAWSFLTTNYPSEAVPYELTAYMANPSWPVPNQQLANWSFEVQALLQWGSGIVDSNPKDIVTDFLTDPNHGVGFPSALLASLTNFRDYCTAAGIFLSPVYDTQAPAAQHLQELLAVANSAFVWSDGVLKIVPYGDQNITGNGVTFTANVTPLYNLTDDDFIAGEGEDPVHVTRRPQSDVFNMVQVEFDNRSYQYNGDIAEAKDQNSIELYGLKPAPVIKAPFIKDPAVARLVAQLALQRQIYIRNAYEFALPFRYVLLEPMDLVTLTDSNLGLNQTTVRLTEVDENEDGSFSCVAEEWPFGVATAATYGSGSTTGITRATPVEKAPKMPEITGSFDATGQLILNLSADGRASKHVYVVRTDRIPTLSETRAGTLVSFAGQSNIATGIVVLAGASVYIGDVAYNWSGGESPLATAVFKREGSGTSAPPTGSVVPLNTEANNTTRDLRFSATAGSGGGGTNLTYDIRLKFGFLPETSIASGNGTTLPRDLTVNRDVEQSGAGRFILTDTATGLVAIVPFVVPSQRGEVTTVGGILKHKRTVNFTDGDNAAAGDPSDTTGRTFTTGSKESGGKEVRRLLAKTLPGDPDNADSVLAGLVRRVPLLGGTDSSGNVDLGGSAWVNRHLGNVSDDAGSDRRAATANQKTGGDRAAATIDSGNIVITTGMDLARAYTNKHLGNVPDDAGSDRRAATAAQKVGGDAANIGMYSSGHVRAGRFLPPVSLAGGWSRLVVSNANRNDMATTNITSSGHTVSVGSFGCVISDDGNVEKFLSFTGSTCTDIATGLNYIYTNDAANGSDWAGGAVTYFCTTAQAFMCQSASVMYVGKITTTAGSVGSGTTGGPICVAPETMILVCDRYGRVLYEKRADQLRAGDYVWTRQDRGAPKMGAFQVIEAAAHPFEVRSRIIFEDGRVMRCSAMHKLALMNGRWSEAQFLSRGERVLGSPVGRVEHVHRMFDIGPVVRIKVRGARTYISNGLLSHNSKAF
jgi:hypothetical protein